MISLVKELQNDTTGTGLSTNVLLAQSALSSRLSRLKINAVIVANQA
jgi:hypothetical protein